jgi:hypothetical protein
MSDKKTLTREEAIKSAIRSGFLLDIFMVSICIPLIGMSVYMPFMFLKIEGLKLDHTFFSKITLSDVGTLLLFLAFSIFLSFLAIRSLTANKRLKSGMKNDPDFKVYRGEKGTIEFHFKTNKTVRLFTAWGNDWFAPYFDTKEEDSGSSKN